MEDDIISITIDSLKNRKAKILKEMNNMVEYLSDGNQNESELYAAYSIELEKINYKLEELRSLV